MNTKPPLPAVRTPLFPGYAEVRSLIKILDGVPKSAVLGMLQAIFSQQGTPQHPVDWSQPAEWIGERLTNEHRDLAQRIWTESHGTVNPRHTYGSYLFINTYQLLGPDPAGVYRRSERANAFLEDDPELMRELDEAEGLPQLLAILANHSPAKRGDLLEEWAEFLAAHSKYVAASSIKDTLSRRLQNLVERGFISRKGNSYTITQKGIDYAAPPEADPQAAPHHDILKAIKAFNDRQTEALRSRLEVMDPYKFEALIKDLLEAMDYEDVIVTKQSGDKGVDVIANYQFGITEIREVVQVKRHKASITRPVLDQLRGALPYHQAIRGTIITLGKFAKGCKDAALFPGAAPITLIDGDKLIELLLKHSVAVKKRPQALFEIDETYFAEAEPEPEADLTGADAATD